ncbi:MAG: CocE/NonD family hydrolase [Pseudomonadota bacterium]
MASCLNPSDRDIVRDDDLRIPLPDGTALSVRLWRPADADFEPVPAIVEYLPYRKRDGTAARDTLNHPYFARHGYACVRIDMRGSGDSDGQLLDEYTETELADGEAALAWLAAQPWCTGAIGMIGISWGGFNGLQMAYRQPPELRAVVSIAATVDRYADDIHYKGGALLTANVAWSAQMLSYMSRPPDPAVRGDAWRGLWEARLASQPLLAATWLAHPRRDPYWAHGSVCEDFGRIRAPVLTVGGQADGYMNAVPALLEHLQIPVRGILGPWVHLYPHVAIPGPQIGFLQECLRWWDRWLKDVPNEVENAPRVNVFRRRFDPPSATATTRSGNWMSEPAWPSPNVAAGSWHLRPGTLTANPGNHDRGAEVWLDIRSPADTGLCAGEYFAWQGPDQPGDQRDDDARSLNFDLPIAAPLTIMGRARLHLRMMVDQPKAQLAVRLNEVAPDGTSLRVAYGVLNVTQTGAAGADGRLPVDKPFDATVELDMTCHEFSAGNRLRVSISTVYWPLLWPAPTLVTARVLCGQSYLVLPVHQATEQPVPQWEPPESAPALALETLRSRALDRRVVRDLGTGSATVELDYDYGCYRDPEHGLVTGSHQRERYDIDPQDPGSARMQCDWTQTLERDGWWVRTETSTSLTSDADNFYLKASIRAWLNDEPVFTRTFDESLPRDCH